jgi:hypothetical protein
MEEKHICGKGLILSKLIDYGPNDTGSNWFYKLFGFFETERDYKTNQDNFEIQ